MRFALALCLAILAVPAMAEEEDNPMLRLCIEHTDTVIALKWKQHMTETAVLEDFNRWADDHALQASQPPNYIPMVRGMIRQAYTVDTAKEFWGESVTQCMKVLKGEGA